MNLHISNSLRRRQRSDSNRARRLRRSALVGLGATIGLCAFATGASAAPPAPLAVPGDPHAPEVAELATEALHSLGLTSASVGLTGGGIEAHPEPTEQFREVLADTAAVTAVQVGSSVREMQLAWLAADTPHQIALLSALTQLGVEYQSMSSEPGVGFDCSGLTSFAWREAGFDIARRSGDQIAQAAPRERDTAMAGDLVEYPGHVMMYLGVDTAVVHASNPENDVELWTLAEDRSVEYGNPIATS